APQDATRRFGLAPARLQSNPRHGGGLEYVPGEGLTAGMDVLLAARRIVLLVSGASKRAILRRTIHCAPCREVPASWLQEAADFTVIADRAAWNDE
ncbi:MAG: sugar phosphate isomerase family, partial [Candidatus Xenobia bacterium]